MHAAELGLELADLVAEPGCHLELQLRGRGVHLLGELADQADELGAGGAEPATAGAARGDLVALIQELTDQMHAAAAELQFEVAARIRDEIKDLKHELRGMQAAGV